MYQGFNNLAGFSCLKPSGAFYAFINIKELGLTADEASAMLLKDFGIAMVPGTAFGGDGEGYLRLSYATAYSRLQEAINRLSARYGKVHK